MPESSRRLGLVESAYPLCEPAAPGWEEISTHAEDALKLTHAQFTVIGKQDPTFERYFVLF